MILALFFSAFLISLLTLFVVIYVSHKYTYFIDCHEENKPQRFHEIPVPRAGGVGIIIALSLVLFIPYGLQLLPSAILAFMSGIFEDFHNSLSVRLRLILQIIAGGVAVWLTHSVVTYLGLGIVLPYGLGIFFSVFAIVGMMNAINIIDGFNGLASGVILIILASFSVISYEHNNIELLSVISILAGAVFGFFVLVFPKGKIFLGDGGAYLLGFMVSLIGISLASEYADVSPWYILSILIYPVWEVIFSIIRKLSIGLSPMKPDKYHIHMLIQRNMTNNNPLTALLLLTFMIPHTILSTFYAHSSMYNIIIVSVFIVCYLLLYLYLFRKDSTG